MSKHANYELIALAKLTKEYAKDETKRLLIDLHLDHFTGLNRNIFKLLSKHFAETKRLPTLEVLKATVIDKAPKDKISLVNAVLQSLEKLEVTDISHDEIAHGLRDRQLITVIDNNIKELTQSALEKDVGKVREILSGVVEQLSVQRVAPQSLSDAIDQEDNSRIIPTYMGELDDVLTGVSGLTIVAAASGGGKSTFMMDVAINQYLKGHSVLFISLELSAKVFGMRLKSYLTGINFTNILQHGTIDRATGLPKVTLTDDEIALIDKTMKEFFDRPNAFRIITEPLDTDELLALITVEKSLYDIDIVYVDYLNLVGSPRGSASESWRNLSDTAKALHRLSMSHGIVTVSAAQVNVEKQPKGGQLPDVKTRGSAELIFSSSLFLYFHVPSGAEGDENSLVLYVLKNRIGPTGAHLMEKDFSKMRIDYVMSL